MSMLKKIGSFFAGAAFVAVLLVTGCAASNPASIPHHSLRLTNADLSAALNKVEATTLTAAQQGIITSQEAINVSQVINNATIASDGIERCADSTTGTVAGCITPLIQSIQSQMTLQGLGIKSGGATNTFQVVINGVLTALTAISNTGGH